MSHCIVQIIYSLYPFKLFFPEVQHKLPMPFQELVVYQILYFHDVRYTCPELELYWDCHVLNYRVVVVGPELSIYFAKFRFYQFIHFFETLDVEWKVNGFDNVSCVMLELFFQPHEKWEAGLQGFFPVRSVSVAYFHH